MRAGRHLRISTRLHVVEKGNTIRYHSFKLSVPVRMRVFALCAALLVQVLAQPSTQCYQGVTGIGFSNPPTVVSALPSLGMVCVEFCFTCSQNDASNCVTGNDYTNYDMVSNFTAVQMRDELQSMYRNLVVCSTNLCNRPSATGACGTPGIPTAAPTLSTSAKQQVSLSAMITLHGCPYSLYMANVTLYTFVIKKALVYELMTIFPDPKPQGAITLLDFSVKDAASFGLANGERRRLQSAGGLLVQFTAVTRSNTFDYSDWLGALETVTGNGDLARAVVSYAQRSSAVGLEKITSARLIGSSPTTNVPTIEPVPLSSPSDAANDGLSKEAWAGVAIGLLVCLAGAVVVYRAWYYAKAVPMSQQEIGVGRRSDLIPHTTGQSARVEVGSRSFAQNTTTRLSVAGGGTSAASTQQQFERGTNDL